MISIKKTDYNAKITDIEGKVPDVSSLATKTTLTMVGKKIHSINSLVNKTDLLQKLLKLKRNLLIIIMKNILQLQILTL